MKYCPKCAHELVEVEIDRKSRLKCPQCDYVFWNNPLPVVAAVVEYGEAVVLVRQKGWPEKWLGLVTGRRTR